MRFARQRERPAQRHAAVRPRELLAAVGLCRGRSGPDPLQSEGAARPALREGARHRVLVDRAVEHRHGRLRGLQLEVHLRSGDADGRERCAAMGLHIDRAGVGIASEREGNAEGEDAAVDVDGPFPATLERWRRLFGARRDARADTGNRDCRGEREVSQTTSRSSVQHVDILRGCRGRSPTRGRFCVRARDVLATRRRYAEMASGRLIPGERNSEPSGRTKVAQALWKVFGKHLFGGRLDFLERPPPRRDDALLTVSCRTSCPRATSLCGIRSRK